MSGEASVLCSRPLCLSNSREQAQRNCRAGEATRRTQEGRMGRRRASRERREAQRKRGEGLRRAWFGARGAGLSAWREDEGATSRGRTLGRGSGARWELRRATDEGGVAIEAKEIREASECIEARSEASSQLNPFQSPCAVLEGFCKPGVSQFWSDGTVALTAPAPFWRRFDTVF